MPRIPRPVPLAELARRIGATLEGDGSLEIGGLGSLAGAAEDEISFVRDEAQRAALQTSAAAALLAPPGLDTEGRPTLRSVRPAHDFSRLIGLLVPVPRPPIGVAAGAHVDPDARIDATASIAAGAVVGAGCRVGARSIVGPNASLVSDVVVGADCWIHAGVVLREGSRLGDRVVLQPGVVIGGDGFGLVAGAEGRPVAMAQRGRVVLEDDVEVGALTTIDRATFDETRIRRGAKIDNLVQIAHNCDVGEDAIVVAQTGLAGGTIVGRGAVVMAQAGSAGHLRIGEGAFVGARAGLHRDVPDGGRVFGAPQMEGRSWHRVVAALGRLPGLLVRVRRLERALGIERRRGDASADD